MPSSREKLYIQDYDLVENRYGTCFCCYRWWHIFLWGILGGLGLAALITGIVYEKLSKNERSIDRLDFLHKDSKRKGFTYMWLPLQTASLTVVGRQPQSHRHDMSLPASKNVLNPYINTKNCRSSIFEYFSGWPWLLAQPSWKGLQA